MSPAASTLLTFYEGGKLTTPIPFRYAENVANENWQLHSANDRLNKQVDSLEAEIERLKAQLKNTKDRRIAS